MNKEFLSGYLLHRREYRETSFLVDLFTLELGKVSAVVKGARSVKNNKKSLLQPFQPLQFILSGRLDLKNLNQLEPADATIALTGTAMFCGMYLNELLNRALAVEMALPALYQQYQRTLAGMAACQQADLEPLLRQFEFNLLAELGYGIDWYADWQTGEEINTQRHYCFVLQHGFQMLAPNQMMKNSVSGEAIVRVQQQNWDKHSLACAKLVSRMAIADLLGNKPLKSRELFQSHLIHPATDKS